MMEGDNLNHQLNKTFHIGIPGNIDGNLRRDYNLCVDTIKILVNNNINVTFTFAGMVLGEHGAAVKSQLDELVTKGARIEFVYNPNSNKDFDEAMANCDLILMPVNVNTVFEGIREIYGQTKATGVIFDGIRFQKPILAPNNFSVPEYLQTSSILYSDAQECAKIITKLSINTSELFLLQENAKINAQNFSVENVRKRLMPHLNQLLSEQ
jgi:glycosyltransferase involved in cell wall biosynthesis